MISYLMYVKNNVPIGWGIFSVLTQVNDNFPICPAGGGGGGGVGGGGYG